MKYITQIHSKASDGFTKVELGYDEKTLEVQEVRITSTSDVKGGAECNISKENRASDLSKALQFQIQTKGNRTIQVPKGTAHMIIDEAGQPELDTSTLKVRFY